MTESATMIVCRWCDRSLVLPPRPAGRIHRCPRCGDRVVGPVELRLLRQRTLALASGAIVLYPLAIGLPIMTLSQFGRERSTSVLGGTGELWTGGHAMLAAVVFGCSVLLPAVKLASLVLLSTGSPTIGCRKRNTVSRLLEISGRWGMLDVLLVAGLVAAVKLGELVRIEAGPGAVAFVACIGLTMLAGATCRDAERHAGWANDFDVDAGPASRGDHKARRGAT